MLSRLLEYAATRGLDTEPGFKAKEARWALEISSDGEYLGVVELGDTAAGARNRGRLFQKAPDLSQAELIAGGVTRSHFLIETAEVVACLSKKLDTPKVVAKHLAFRRLLEEAAEEVPDLRAAAQALADDQIVNQIRGELVARKAKPADRITVAIDGELVVDAATWHDWWRRYRASILPPSAGNGRMRCFGSGDLVEPAKTHPKVQGLASVGGLSTGDVLCGFDKESFCSYGLSQSENSAMSVTVTTAYRAALNDLIQMSGTKLAGTIVVHWFKERLLSPEDDPLDWLHQSDQQSAREAAAVARELLGAIRSGKRPDLADNSYYILTLSGASGRIMVRDWSEGPFEELAANVAQWFDDLQIVRRDGAALARTPKLFAVLAATVRDPRDLTAPLVTSIWRSAIRNELIPAAAHSGALKRFRADVLKDESPNHARVGLLRAWHLRKWRMEGRSDLSEQLTPRLNADHPSTAYQSGRLMALLASLQRAALGDVGASVVQRYYAAASTTPALVLGRLTRTSQFHLGKLDPGLAHWFEDRIAEVWSHFEQEPPRTLSLEEQSLFALGYYQQLAQMRVKNTTVESDVED